MDVLLVSLIVFVALILMLGGGVWIAISLMAAGWVGMQFVPNVASSGNVLAQTIWSSGASWTLAALPLFVWMGEILFRTRLAEDMFRGISPWLNWLPGRLVHVNVFACGMFGAVSGSSAATCATIAKIALPELGRRGYPERLTLGALAGAGTLGILVPPSIMMVIYGVSAEVSILQCFLAGFVPALIVVGLYSAYIAGWALLNREHMPPGEPAMSFVQKLRASANLIPTLLLIAVVFTALVSGIATVTECAAWGVLGSLAVAAWSRQLTWENFWQSVMGATRLTAMIMLILAGSTFLSTAMAYTGIPAGLADWVKEMNLGPFGLIMALVVMYILLGMVLDGISMIVLTTSVVLPMVTQAGFDLVWFGIFMVLMIEMAQITPPLGFNLFVLQTMSGRDSYEIASAAIPFFLLLVVAVMIVTAFPGLVLWLPHLVFPS